MLETIDHVLPDEFEYLRKYDSFRQRMEHLFDMPEKTVSLLITFLRQQNGKLSKRARENEFSGLSDEEVGEVERAFQAIFVEEK